MARTISTPRKIPPISENAIGQSLSTKQKTAKNKSTRGNSKAVEAGKTSQVRLNYEKGQNKVDGGIKIKMVRSRKRKKGPWKYFCHFCPKAFSTPSFLKAHMTTHSHREKAFPCPICGKGFAHKVNMKVHFRRHRHRHLNEKPFKCPHPGCSSSFLALSELIQHSKVHSEEKPFVCPHKGCGKAFSRSGHLSRHSRIHSGQKPFACPFPGCRKTFNDEGHVTRHRKIHDRQNKGLTSSKLI